MVNNGALSQYNGPAAYRTWLTIALPLGAYLVTHLNPLFAEVEGIRQGLTLLY